MPERMDIERDETAIPQKGADVEVDESSIEKPEPPQVKSHAEPPVEIPPVMAPPIPRVRNGPKREGFINGRVPKRHKTTPIRSRGGKVVLGILVLIIIGSACVPLFMPIHEGTKVIDGDFSKWTGARIFSDSGGRYSLMVREKSLLAFFEHTSLFSPAGVVWVLIDADGDANTGYTLEEVGAEYLYEVYGENRSIVSSTLFSFQQGRAKTDWNGFRAVDPLPSATDGSKLEMGYPLPVNENTRAYFARSSQGKVTISQGFIPIKGTALLCEIARGESVAKNETQIMRLKLRGWGGDAHLESLTFSGDGIGRISLYDGGSRVADAPIPGKVSFSPALSISEDTLRTLDVHVTPSDTAIPGSTITLSLTGAGSDAVISSRGNITVPAYAYIPGSEHRIDGLFGEWGSPGSDPAGDVKDPSGKSVSDDSGDIILYSSSESLSGSYHYLKVAGDILNGALIPATTPKNKPPTGPVHVNITLPQEELLNEDQLYIFFDSDSNITTGYLPGILGADSAALIRGNDRVISSSRLKYTGNGSSWNWSDMPGRIMAGRSGAEIEVYADSLTGPSYFYLVRWNGNRDSASEFFMVDLPESDPYIIEGYVTDENGAKIAGLLVEVCNDRTGECLVFITVDGGYYQVDFSNLPGGYQNGDGITVTATNMTSGKTGTAHGIVDTSQGGSRIDVTIPAGEGILLVSVWAGLFRWVSRGKCKNKK